MLRKKILHLALPTGGVKTYVAHVLEYANPQMFEFAVIASANGLFESYCREKLISYYPLDLDRGLNPFKSAKLLMDIIKVIKKEKPDIIHAHSAKGGFLGRLAAKITGVKVIYTPHAFSYLSFTGPKRIIFYLLEYIARSWTTLLLAISYSEANCAIYELGFKKDKVKVILNSIPIKGGFMKDNFSPPSKIRMIGRLTPQKNPLQFIEIADKLLSKYPALQFSILGAGIHDDLKIEIDDFIAAHNLSSQVKIEKWGDAKTSETFLQDTDIYLTTSIFEGLPFSLLEAMFLGIPCIVTKVEGNTDVIQNNENGFSCLSIDEFCEKIELIINDKILRLKIGKAGHDYVMANHDIEKTVKKLEFIYTNLIDPK